MAVSTAWRRCPQKARPGISQRQGGMSRRHIERTLAARFVLSAAFVLAVTLASAAENELGARLPRFVSLRSDLVNLRVGPGEHYPIQLVLTRTEIPLDIVRQFEHQRLMRDCP